MISCIYVNGEQKWLSDPRKTRAEEQPGDLIRPGRLTTVRLRDQPSGPVISEHIVSALLFDEAYKGRWRTGGNWYSRLPDSAFEGR